jgi:hypothetical protein
MSKERRNSSRKSAYTPAFLFTGAGKPLGKCFVKDMSESGAKLVYRAAEELPVDLLLTMGRVRQRCRLMWRQDNEIGVHFGDVVNATPSPSIGPSRASLHWRLALNVLEHAQAVKSRKAIELATDAVENALATDNWLAPSSSS